jgi:large conductance mechanosensitive channel
MLKEFRDFINRGNVLDLAVGIIIGTAFGAVVNSLVNDVIMPPIGFLLAGVDFAEIGITLGTNAAGEPVVMQIGAFINAIINFLIVAFVVFLIVRAVNRMMTARKKEEAQAAAAPDPAAERQEKLIAALDRLNATLAKKA